MRLHRWLAPGCAAALAVGLAACGGSSGSSGATGGGGTSGPSSASSSLVVETSFVLKTLDPARDRL
jgi:hypothetical protein